MAKIAFVTTVKNDAAGLAMLLDSLAKQTRQPDETIIIDAVKTKTNRSQGRNLGIKKAQSEIIAISDAGCRLDRYWLEKITTALEKNSADVVVGNYQPLTKNVFQKCLAVYTCRLAELPASRSIAFRKKAWRQVGGYPEALDYCEDLVFAQRLQKAGWRFVRSPEAMVFWPQRENLLQAAQQFFNYASGDSQALYWPHLAKILLVYLRYLGGIWLLYYSWFYCCIVVLLYCLYAVIKNYHRVKNWRALVYLPVLQITADLAVMCGAFWGIIKR